MLALNSVMSRLFRICEATDTSRGERNRHATGRAVVPAQLWRAVHAAPRRGGGWWLAHIGARAGLKAEVAREGERDGEDGGHPDRDVRHEVPLLCLHSALDLGHRFVQVRGLQTTTRNKAQDVDATKTRVVSRQIDFNLNI